MQQQPQHSHTPQKNTSQQPAAGMAGCYATPITDNRAAAGLPMAPAAPPGIIQRRVYIDNYNASKITSLKALKLNTKKKLAELLGVEKIATADDRNDYLYSAADPRISTVAQAVAGYIKQNYTITGEEAAITQYITEQLTQKAADAGDYALNSLVTEMVAALKDGKKWIQDKAMPAMGSAQTSFEQFVSSSYDMTLTTPNRVVRTEKSDVTSSFTSQGQQVNTIAFLNKTPIGVFHNKDRDRTVLPELSKSGFSVPRLKDDVHSHSEDEVIYETLFGNLKDMVTMEAAKDKTTTITFMISDLTCHHNQITSAEQRKVRSCAENIVRYSKILKEKHKNIQVQVIYARPYNLNHYADKSSARYGLAVLAEQALQLFHANGIRARAIKSFFPPDQVHTDVLADPEAYGVKEPGTPQGFDPSDTPFPSLSKKQRSHEAASSAHTSLSVPSQQPAHKIGDPWLNEEQESHLRSLDITPIRFVYGGKLGQPPGQEEEQHHEMEQQQSEDIEEAQVPHDGVMSFTTWEAASYRQLTAGQKIRITHHQYPIADRVFRLKTDYDPSLMEYPDIGPYVERIE